MNDNEAAAFFVALRAILYICLSIYAHVHLVKYVLLVYFLVNVHIKATF